MQSEQIFVEANGLRHAVRMFGDKNAPAAILLHGFPNSSALWDDVAPLVAKKGYRVVLPDLRGFGETDMAPNVEDYEINRGAIPDIIALMDKLNIQKAHIVGHDFGAPVAWGLAAQHRDRFHSLTAISVGHARAYLKAGMKQKLMSWYILFHQMRGICEALYRFNDWAVLRSHWSAHGDIDSVIANLSRPGRLTASLNWYRSNISVARMLKPPPLGAFGEEIVRIPYPRDLERRRRLSRRRADDSLRRHSSKRPGAMRGLMAPATGSLSTNRHGWRSRCWRIGKRASPSYSPIFFTTKSSNNACVVSCMPRVL